MTGKIHRNLAFAALPLICVLAAAGCAMGPAAESRPAGPAPEAVRQELRALGRTQQERLEELDSGLAAAAEPDCRRAHDLVETICQLTQRICHIAARHPGDDQLEADCHDAQQRCEQARVKTAVRCP